MPLRTAENVTLSGLYVYPIKSCAGISLESACLSATGLRYDRRFLNSGRSSDWLRQQAPNLKDVSPINHPDQFSIPILLVHGRKDRNVPVKQSRELAERLQKEGKNLRYVEQPEGDHNLSRQADRLQFLTELEAFLKQHNPA